MKSLPKFGSFSTDLCLSHLNKIYIVPSLAIPLKTLLPTNGETTNRIQGHSIVKRLN